MADRFDVSGFYIRGMKDNEARLKNYEEWSWSDFCRMVKSDGHEVRGETGVHDKPSRDAWKEGRGAKRMPGFWPVEANFNLEPEEDKDFSFLSLHGSDGVARRCARTVAGGKACWLDVDDLTPEDYERLCDFLDEGGYDALIYSSYNHGFKQGVYKIRLVLRLDRHQAADEIDFVRRGAAKVLRVNADDKCFGRHTLFYLPAVHPDWQSEAFIEVFGGGNPFDVDELLEENPDKYRQRAKAQIEVLREKYTGAPASDVHKTRATLELEGIANSIRYFVAGPKLRPLLLQATKKLGHYIASGCLELEATRDTLHQAVREMWEAGLKETDEQTLETRLNQVDTGLRDGAREPKLPLSEAAQRLIEDGESKDRIERIKRRLLDQHPKETPVDVISARRMVLDAMKKFSDERGSADTQLVVLPGGVGKSTAQAALASYRAQGGRQTVIMTQEHAVLSETRSKLAPDVRSCHKFSALSPPPGMEDVKCPRHLELADYIHDTRTSLRKICATQCVLKDTCPALAAARQRDQDERQASVLFVSQAGCSQAVDWLESGALLAADEQPVSWEQVLIKQKTMLEMSKKTPNVTTEDQRSIRIAVGVALGKPYSGPHLPEVEELPVDIYNGMSPQDRELRRAACQVVREISGGQYKIVDGSLQVWRKTSARNLLDRFGGTICDATPILEDLPKDTSIVRIEVKDAVEVTRGVIIPGGAEKMSRPALQADLAAKGNKVRACLSRCFAMAAVSNQKRVLFISFKEVVAFVRKLQEESPLLFPDTFDTATYGAVRGKNTWQTYDFMYVVGTPMMNRRDMCKQILGPDAEEEEVFELWERMAASDLEQSVARGRPTSRKQPLMLVVDAGDCVPIGWSNSPEQERVIVGSSRQNLDALLSDASSRFTDKDIAAFCGVSVRAVGKWRRNGVPERLHEGKSREAQLRALLGLPSLFTKEMV